MGMVMGLQNGSAGMLFDDDIHDTDGDNDGDDDGASKRGSWNAIDDDDNGDNDIDGSYWWLYCNDGGGDGVPKWEYCWWI